MKIFKIKFNWSFKINLCNILVGILMADKPNGLRNHYFRSTQSHSGSNPSNGISFSVKNVTDWNEKRSKKRRGLEKFSQTRNVFFQTHFNKFISANEVRKKGRRRNHLKSFFWLFGTFARPSFSEPVWPFWQSFNLRGQIFVPYNAMVSYL